jgi:Uma2 family endonuclease
VLGEIDWIVSQDTVLRPDLLVVCGREPERHVEQTPAIVVEILSENTRQRDLVHKRSIYERQSVPIYLIVDPDESKLTALRLNADGEFAEISFDGELSIDLCDDCHIQVNCAGLFR